MPRRSEHPRGYGLFLAPFREQTLKLSQESLAACLHCSRSLIGAIETGREPPSEAFLNVLAAAFPKYRDEILDGVRPHTRHKEQNTPRTHLPRAIRHAITLRINAGQLTAARADLHDHLKSGLTVADQIWGLEQLSLVEGLLAEPKISQDHLRSALELIDLEYGYDNNRRIELLERYCVSLTAQQMHSTALSMLISELLAHPESGRLWYRKGIIHAEQYEVVEAYASLTTALSNKGPRVEVLLLRGEVLLTAGHAAGAQSDLSGVLGKSKLTTTQTIRVRSGLAYAAFRAQIPSGEPRTIQGHIPASYQQSVAELQALCQSAQGSPWPHYYLSCCAAIVHKYYSDPDDAMINMAKQELVLAIQCTDPPLDPWHHRYATDIVKNWPDNN